jgi:hypothetical protein
MLFMVEAKAGTANKTPQATIKHNILRMICSSFF